MDYSLRHARRARATRRSSRPAEWTSWPGAVVGGLVVLALPWAFGGVHWTSAWLAAVGLGIALLLCVPLLLRERTLSPFRSGLVWVLGAAVLLGAIQLIPSRELVRWLSPVSEALQNKFALPNPPPTSITISLEPPTTRGELALLVLALLALFLGLVISTRSLARRTMLYAIALNGLALAFLGFCQLLSSSRSIYWTFALVDAGSPFASFVNRNNAGGYLNLCLAVVIGLLAYEVARARENLRGHFWLDDDRHDDMPSRYGSSLATSIISSIASRLSQLGSLIGPMLALLNTRIVLLLICLLTMTAGVAATRSRGAMVALAVGGLVTAAFAMRRGSARGVMLIVAVVLCGVMMMMHWLGLRDVTEERLSTLSSIEEIAANGRWKNWGDAVRVIPEFWPVGTGLGTYNRAYHLHQTAADRAWFHRAENQYLEALVSGGVAGLLLILVAIAIVARSCWRLLGSRSERARAIGMLGTFALVTQSVHAVTDYGLQLPANSVLFALLCGVVVGFAAERRLAAEPALATRRVRAPKLRLAALLLLASWSVWETAANASVERAMARARFEPAPPRIATARVEPESTDLRPLVPNQPLKQELLENAIAGLEAALERRPDDPRGLWQLAETRMRLFELRHFYRKLPYELDRSPRECWHHASLYALHAQLLAGERSEALMPSDEKDAETLLLEARRELRRAAMAAPLAVRPRMRLAHIEQILGNSQRAEQYLEQAAAIGHYDAEMLYRIGLLESIAGRYEPAADAWRQSLSLTDRYLPDIIRAVLQGALGDDTAPHVRRMLPSKLPTRVEAARLLAADAKWEKFAEQLAASVIEDAKEGKGEPLELPILAVAYELEGKPVHATEVWREVVERSPMDAEARYQFARLLKRIGRREQARRQAAQAVELAPRHTEYAGLLDELSSAAHVSD